MLSNQLKLIIFNFPVKLDLEDLEEEEIHGYPEEELALLVCSLNYQRI